MLPIHLACYKGKPNDCENLQHVYFRKGLAMASNGSLLVVMPAMRLLGNLIDPNEDFAIHAEDWKAGKMDKASFVDRNGDTFTARDKNARVIGQCVAKRLPDSYFTMPDFAVVWPAQRADDPIASFAINPAFINTVTRVTGCAHMVFRKSENPNRALTLQCLSGDMDVLAYALIMPSFISKVVDSAPRWDAFNAFFPGLKFSADADYAPVFGADTPNSIPGFIAAETSVANEVDDLL